ncbi:DUF6339 family protein [Streptomyces purpureus]|nr:DUF6339 family protein [Streptomyces purpureus]
MALLSDTVAVKHLTRGVLSGQEDPPFVALVRASESVGGTQSRWSIEPLRHLLEEAQRRHSDVGRAQADRWLAPRLHATLRLTRAEAAEPALWNYLALVVAPDYVVWRHRSGGDGPKAGLVTAERFCGLHYKQAFARLWWTAELFRDGSDYRPVEIAGRIPDLINTVLRLDVVDHRPTARAVTRLVEQGVVRTGRELNDLVSAVNVAGSTIMYEVLAPDEGPDPEAVEYWISEAEVAPPVPHEKLPEGPDDGPIPARSVETLSSMFEKLYAEVPRRGKEPCPTEVERPRGVSLDKPYSPTWRA